MTQPLYNRILWVSFAGLENYKLGAEPLYYTLLYDANWSKWSPNNQMLVSK